MARQYPSTRYSIRNRRVSRGVVGGCALACFAAGCRFTVPDVREQQYLLQQGSFPSGSPSWMVAGTAANRHRGSVAGGFMPESFTPAESLPGGGVVGAHEAEGSASQYTVPSVEREELAASKRLSTVSTSPLSDRSRVDSRVSSQVANPVRPVDEKAAAPEESSGGAASAGETSVAESVTASAQKPQDDSSSAAAGATDGPLQRIERACPSSEKEVMHALGLTNVAARAQEYEKLVLRCPSSVDLWLWLGKDYDRSQRGDKAARCFQKALSLDPANQEARSLLAQQERARAQADRQARDRELLRIEEEEAEAAQNAAFARRKRRSMLLSDPLHPATPAASAEKRTAAPGRR